MNILKMFKSFQFALAGLKYMLLNENNFKFQLIISLSINTLALFLKILFIEHCIIILCCLLVLSLEIINSAIEKTCNLITKEIHPQIKIIKDISAGAVLLASIGSIIIGFMILYPYLIKI